MTIDVALLGVLISLIFAVLIGGVFIGRLSEKVASNRREIGQQQKNIDAYREENREEHKGIVARLDKLIMNGGGKA